MLKFLQKLIIAICIVSVLPILYISVFFAVTHEFTSKAYIAAIVDKLERLGAVEESAIIIMGDSNVAFGINSEVIEASYGLPVVNMGLHGGLGDRFMEEAVREYIGEGDIVILAYSSYATDGAIQDAMLVWPMVAESKEMQELVVEEYLLDVLHSLPAYMLSTSIAYMKGEEMYSHDYARDAFNQYGDIGYERSALDMEFTKDTIDMDISDSAINRLNEYNQYCNSVGATLLIAAYPLAYGEYATYTSEDLDNFQEDLAKGLDCQVISEYKDYLYDYDYFYNTSLHLNDAGAELRTKQLIEDLSWYIP